MQKIFTKKHLILLVLSFIFILSFEALGKKRKKRRWSLSFTNAYTFYEHEKSSTGKSNQINIGVDGQMNTFFSNLELRRNFGRYEVGGKIQLFNAAFVSPFLKINMVKNYYRSSVIPYLTIGVVPARLAGAYARLGLDLAINRYLVFSPFVSVFAWYKVKDLEASEGVIYQRTNFHVNGGLSTTIYF